VYNINVTKKQKGKQMATATMYKIVLFSNTVLPEIYLSYDAAKQALKQICENNVATFGRVVLYDDETGQLY